MKKGKFHSFAEQKEQKLWLGFPEANKTKMNNHNPNDPIQSAIKIQQRKQKEKKT